MKTTRIALWSGPRNVSTALMYSFANRQDCTVLDEPFFGAFLQQTGVWRPSRDEVLLTMELDQQKVLSEIKTKNDSPVLFIKNMANHLEGMDLPLVKSFKNIILCRAPEAVLTSYTKQIESPTVLDLGYKHQLGLLRYLVAENEDFYVLQSDALRNNPAGELKNLCKYLDIPFSENMLQWKAGARREDGVWAKYWYHSVHKSTGFTPVDTQEYKCPDGCEELLKQSKELYNEILNYKR